MLVAADSAERRPLSSMALLVLLQRHHAGVTVHGFRSSFRDYIGEETSLSETVAEMALAHKVGSEVERSYKRGDAFKKRIEMMEVWAAHCTTPDRPSNVASFEEKLKAAGFKKPAGNKRGVVIA